MQQLAMPARACPVCAYQGGAVLGRLTYALFDDLAMPGAKTLRHCGECGMLYDDVEFTESQLQEYYRSNEHYAVASAGGTGGTSDDNLARYDRILDILSPPRGGFVLDYGCGQGGFVARCAERGWRAAGIEPSERSRAAGLAAGLEIHASLAVFLKAHPGEEVAAVTLSHVLEHLLAPLETLRDLAARAPGSLVYIEVPDAAACFAPSAVRWHELYFEHVCHFRHQDLTNLAGLAGVELSSQGEVAFSRGQPDVRCLFATGRLSGKARPVPADVRPCPPPLPEVPGRGLVPDGSPLALWGVSQYAMLLLGSRRELAGRVRRLFDASPAKIGRSVNGIVVEPSANLGELPTDHLLLIPRSAALEKMRSLLPSLGVVGNHLTV